LTALVEEPDSEQPIRVWVPGCATGEEAYSMAMLLTEEIEVGRQSWRAMA
jgi:two-component system CheB/CheR fusion protein